MGWKRELWPEWTIISDLGSGASGKVFKIRRQDIGGTYYAALKVITIPQTLQQIEQLRSQNMTDSQISAYYRQMVANISKEITVMERFKGNSNIVSYEDHKIVPHINGFGWDVMIRMELLISLPEYLETHTVDEKEICKIGVDICRALILCEKEKIIHRDVKPGNIFVSDFGDYKLGDFSLVKEYDFNAELSSPKGTFSYMAPEVCHGGHFDYSVDIYGLGLILYRLLNRGRGPFQPLPPKGITPDLSEEANRKRLSAEILPKPVDASPTMSAIIQKACARNPQKRFQNARQMQDSLLACLHSNAPNGKKLPVTQYLKKALTVFQDSDEIEPITSNSDRSERTGKQKAEYEPEQMSLEKQEAQQPRADNALKKSQKKKMSDFFTSAGDL